jgi:bifunctional non-homologous end joining protein LigD
MVDKRGVITHRDLSAPTKKAKAFNHPDWVWELKHDGYRALLLKDGEQIRMLTRKGNDLVSYFPEIAEDLRKLPDIVIDGELVTMNDKGKPEFHQLRGRCAIRNPQRIEIAASSKPAAVFAFDLLQRYARLDSCVDYLSEPALRCICRLATERHQLFGSRILV